MQEIAEWGVSIHALLAESDLAGHGAPHPVIQFLSTLSLRRATHRAPPTEPLSRVSIHALLAESDLIILIASC